jgi:2-amino-4-hydroxy-6-hydroxymethyldihydropteridine diphosphokinase
MAVKVAIALGSNVGDRRATLNSAIEALAGFMSNLRASSFYDTPFVGTGPSEGGRGESVQPSVLNAAIIGVTSLAAHPLLERLLAIELEFGRTRPYGGAPRTLDLDLILYGGAMIDEPGLQVPHPRFRDRRFVLEPLAEILPGLVHPRLGKSARELLRGCPDTSAVSRYAGAPA